MNRVALPLVIDDGGRSAAGFKGRAGDCVTRSIAIVGRLDYRTVYDQLAAGQASIGRTRSARDGIDAKVYKRWLADKGWAWTPTMRIGQGTTTHLAEGELPGGRLLVRCSRHLTAVIDGTIHDTHDPARGGSRAVYGYWTPPKDTD